MIVSKAKALSVVDEVIEEAENEVLKSALSKASLENWEYRLFQAMDRVFESDSRELVLLRSHNNSTAISGAIVNRGIPRNQAYLELGSERVRNQVDSLKGIRKNIEADRISVSALASSSRDISEIELICERFHLVQRRIKNRHDDRTTLVIDDEYDVQDLFHALLHLFFDDIRAEEWTPSYAGSSSRVDFLLKDIDTVVELKKTRNGMKSKNVGEQLIIDIAKYKSHPDCKILYCFVYDPEGRIDNPIGVENDLQSSDNGFQVIVNITPKGS